MSNAPAAAEASIEAFISRWKDAEAAERANYQMFLAELCELLAVAPPDPSGADNAFNQYVFDRAITRSKPDGSQTTVWADLYKRSCFILETKQGANAVEAASSRLPDTKRQDAATTRHFSILTEKERKIHDDGLVSVLKQLHDEIDAATAEAYGWQDLGREACPQASAHAAKGHELSKSPTDTQPPEPSRRLEGKPPYQGKPRSGEPAEPLADRLAQGDENLEQQILQRLVDLNHERAAEEAQGKIRWLRPEYQDPEFGQKTEDRGRKTEQEELPGTEAQLKTGKLVTEKLNWPKTLPEQVANLRALLPETGPDPAALAAHFGKRTKKRVQEIDQILETLRNLGQL